MKENELIAGNWYKIRTTNKASYPNQEYFFKCQQNGRAITLNNVSEMYGVAGNGDLTQTNGSFKGNDYTLCDQSEVLWCEDCVKQNRYIPFDRNNYQTEPQFDLIF